MRHPDRGARGRRPRHSSASSSPRVPFPKHGHNALARPLIDHLWGFACTIPSRGGDIRLDGNPIPRTRAVRVPAVAQAESLLARRAGFSPSALEQPPPRRPDRRRARCPRFCRAWLDTACACDALQIALDPARPIQRFTRAEPPPLPVVPLDPEKLEAWIAERAEASLVGRSLPWEAWLLHLGPDRHVFVLLAFHAVLDGVSASLLLEQIAERYADRVPPAPASYRDYLAAEAAYRESPEGRADQAWWSRRLEGGAPPLRPYGLSARILRRRSSGAGSTRRGWGCAWTSSPGTTPSGP